MLTTIAISKLQPGTVLGYAIHDEGGEELLGSGVPVTDRFLEELRARGVWFFRACRNTHE